MKSITIISILIFTVLLTNAQNISENPNKPVAKQGQNSIDFPILNGNYLGQETPDLIPELFAPSIVSTKEFNDRDLTISPDGKQIFFARTKTGNSNDYEYDIMFSELTNDGWTKPQIAWFSSKYGEVEAFFNPIGNELFFNSNRPGVVDGDSEHWETWVMKKEENVWTEPKMLKAPFNRVCHTTFTKDGKMYYTKEDEPALYRTSYKNSVFGEPEKLSSIINSTKVQYNCFISSNEKYLIFTRPAINSGGGRGDLFIAFRNENDEWSEPVNMGSDINSPGLESCPSVSPDGKFLFFTSNKAGNNDVYWVDIKIIERFKQKNKK